MDADILETLPVQKGHFLLESGYHTDLWFTLEALFVNPEKIAPLISSLAIRLSAHAPTAICGPLLGGAFVAQAIASKLCLNFYYTEAVPIGSESEMFSARYVLTKELHRLVREERIALVDDVISAGSSVRASAEALANAGSSLVAVGALVSLGTKAEDHFASVGVPVEVLARREFNLWEPSACPLCAQRMSIENRTSDRGRY
jgi:orotate phosphoribosyltransferase